MTEQPTGEEEIRLPDISVSFRLDLDASEFCPPDTQFGVGEVQLAHEDSFEMAASVAFRWSPETSQDTGADWLLQFEIPRISSRHPELRLGLRLVAAVMAHFTAGRTTRVTVVAEPYGWQCLKTA